MYRAINSARFVNTNSRYNNVPADLILQYQQLNLDSQTQATSPPPTPTPANTPLYNLDDTSQKESSTLAKLSVSCPKNFFNSNQIRFNLAFFSIRFKYWRNI